MDLDHFMDQRLQFVEYFYNSTTAVFTETLRKIEQGEEPFVDHSDPEYADGPAFMSEWEDANAAMTLSGAACLDVLQSSFHAFLDQYMRLLGVEDNIPKLSGLKKKSWFGNYRAYFSDLLGLPWEEAGADVSLIEQVILTRNDFTHNVDLLSLYAFQTSRHAEKYPNSPFVDARWKDFPFAATRIPLVVPSETLFGAISELRKLCRFLEAERYNVPKREQEQALRSTRSDTQ